MKIGQFLLQLACVALDSCRQLIILPFFLFSHLLNLRGGVLYKHEHDKIQPEPTIAIQVAPKW
jgi:hypothetical protein